MAEAARSFWKRLNKENIEAFISPLVIDEVSYVLMVQTARKQEARRTQKSFSIFDNSLMIWKQRI